MDGVYSIDYMIGEPEYLGKGLGKQMVSKLLEIIKQQEKDARAVIVQPEPENAASCNTLLSCGFVFDDRNKIYIINL